MVYDEGSRPALYEQLAHVGKALSNGKRLELIELLVQSPRGVVELAEAARLNVTTTSAHLQTLKRAGLVAAHRTGTAIRYSIRGNDVAGLYGQLLDVAAAHSADVDAGEAMVLDVRPALEFEAGHLPGAMSIPLGELAERLDELPADLEIVACCRGAYCVFSHHAVRLLNSHGRRAVRLADGIVECHAAGEPLTATAGLTGDRG